MNLSPCPFCGNKRPEMIQPSLFAIYCTPRTGDDSGCGMIAGYSVTAQAAADKWNTRASADKDRLDWLEKNPNSMGGATWVNFNIGRCFSFGAKADATIGDCAAAKRDLRGALDAARAEDPAPGTETTP